MGVSALGLIWVTSVACDGDPPLRARPRLEPLLRRGDRAARRPDAARRSEAGSSASPTSPPRCWLRRSRCWAAWRSNPRRGGLAIGAASSCRPRRPGSCGRRESPGFGLISLHCAPRRTPVRRFSLHEDLQRQAGRDHARLVRRRRRGEDPRPARDADRRHAARQGQAAVHAARRHRRLRRRRQRREDRGDRQQARPEAVLPPLRLSGRPAGRARCASSSSGGRRRSCARRSRACSRATGSRARRSRS